MMSFGDMDVLLNNKKVKTLENRFYFIFYYILRNH